MLFVSRLLGADSLLRRWAEQHGWPLTARSLLRFTPVAYTPPAGADWWFFYSSRAVAHALAQHEPFAQVRCAAMGPGTAAALNAAGFPPHFTGSGDPATVGTAFARVAAGQTVFFPRARQSRRSVETVVADHCTVVTAVCYANEADPPPAAIPARVYVFTSPLNVAAYLDHWGADAGAVFIAIGPSTAAALGERGITPLVAPSPTEAAVVDLLETLPSGE